MWSTLQDEQCIYLMCFSTTLYINQIELISWLITEAIAELVRSLIFEQYAGCFYLRLTERSMNQAQHINVCLTKY